MLITWGKEMVTSKKPTRKSKQPRRSAEEPTSPQQAAAPHERMAVDMLHLIGRGVNDLLPSALPVFREEPGLKVT